MSKCEGCQKYADCSSGSMGGLTWPCGAYAPTKQETEDRLTYRSPRFNQAVTKGACLDVKCNEKCDECKIGEIISRLCAYEDTGMVPEEIVALRESFQELKKEAVPLLEEKINGRLVLLPCKAGDVVFAAETSQVIPLQLIDVGVYLSGIDGGDWESLRNFGETVFLTREAAEAALKKQEG